MIVKEIQVKTCLGKSKLTDYVINPYTGCSHACVYCYADFIKRFQNIKENWGDFVYAKVNCPELLEKELESAKPGHIWMSSVCDCYMPIEAKYKLTRRILEIIAKSPFKSKFTMEILTKSTLVRRDFDLLKEIGFERLELGMSLGILDEKAAKIIEPFASSPIQRIRVLKDAGQNRIKVFGFISPVISGLTDLEEIFRQLSFCEYVWVEILNIKSSVVQRLRPIIEKEFPDKLGDFDYMIDHYEEFCEKIKKQCKELEQKYALKVKEVVVH